MAKIGWWPKGWWMQDWWPEYGLVVPPAPTVEAAIYGVQRRRKHLDLDDDVAALIIMLGRRRREQS